MVRGVLRIKVRQYRIVNAFLQEHQLKVFRLRFVNRPEKISSLLALIVPNGVKDHFLRLIIELTGEAH